MYFRIPDEMKQMVLERLKHQRFWTLVLIYPIMVLGIAGLCTLFLFTRGLHYFYFIEKYTSFSKTQMVIGSLVGSLALSALFMLYLSRQIYKGISLEDYNFCTHCNAVDNEQEGYCPFCKSILQSKATFLVALDKDEIKTLGRLGLKPCRKAWDAPRMAAQLADKSQNGNHDSPFTV